MKIDSVNRDIQRSDSFQERSMGLAVGSEAFVFNVLRKDLYSDPIGSLIREYTVNAQDEHRKHNKTNTPIHIQVPNSFSPELHIRDFAGGLTEEQVFNFFGNYGASDKRDSNVAVGFFGLGCKSAFAYTDSYIVKSFKDGKCYTFNIYIDETEIGKTAKIAEEDTTEANGVQIIVPVLSRDIQEFQRKVISTVSYFKVKPTITGLAEAPVFNTKVASIKGTGWEYFGSGSPVVVMGEIPYPLDYYKMGNVESWEGSLLRSNIVLYVNIGDVQVTASREALQMSPKTIATVREHLKSIKDAMLVETEKAFKDAKNLIEAKTLYHSVVQVGGGYSDIIRNSGIAVKWNGKEITDNTIRFDGVYGVAPLHRVTNYSTTYKGNVRSFSEHRLNCRTDFEVYYDDTNKSKVGYSRRARTLFAEGKKNILVLDTSDVKDLEKTLGMKVSELKSFNAVVPTMPASKAGGGTGIDGSKLVKHKAKFFALNIDKLKKGVYGSASEYWDLQEVENPKGVYVSIDRFKPTGEIPVVYDLYSLANLVTALTSAGIDLNVPIYGIKKGGSTDGLVRLDKWVDSKVAKNKELLENHAIVEGYTSARYSVDNVSKLDVSVLPNNSVAKKYAINYNNAQKLHTEFARKQAGVIFRFTSVKVKRDETLTKLFNEFTAKYPMLTLIDDNAYSKTVVTDYIRQQELAK